MNRINLRITFMLLLLFSASSAIIGRQNATYMGVEKVRLFTDRSVYITGEEVHFSAFLLTDDKQGPGLSQILYAEIILPDGKHVAGNKFPVLNYSSEGCLVIPKDIITGVYYLKAYTKYMRNWGPEAYAYVEIKIVNPMRSEVLIGKDTTFQEKDLTIAGNSDDSYDITIDRNEYTPRTIVNVSIKAKVATDSRGLCISVVPAAFSSKNMLLLRDNDHRVSSLHFLPETRGVSITGEIKDNTNGKTVPNVRLNLSVIGKGRDFIAMQTDSAGRYSFPLPAYVGFRDLFLCVEKGATTHTKILIDNDFCAVPVHLPSPVFHLSANENAVALNMALNAQIGTFFADTLACSGTAERTDRAFYGVPDKIIIINNYVQLPTLEEYFNELPTAVKVRKRHGDKYFKVLGTQAEMVIFDPLVLLDWVAVDNPEMILAVSPTNISRIEVVNEPYIKGDMIYGGIVSIISKRGDFAGIDLPASGIFLNYCFQVDKQICNLSESHSPTIPDVRNTVYWEPNLLLNADKRTLVSFSTPDIPGRYAIVLKEITRDGNILSHTEFFEVKKEQ